VYQVAAPVVPLERLLSSPGDRVGVLGQMMAGAMAGMASWLFLHPVDVLKTRAQALPDTATSADRSVGSVLRSVLLE